MLFIKKESDKMMKNRYTNPYFWVGLVAVMIAASGMNVETLTSWQLLGDALLSIVMNPVTFVAVCLAALGVIVNPTTKGLKD